MMMPARSQQGMLFRAEYAKMNSAGCVSRPDTVPFAAEGFAKASTVVSATTVVQSVSVTAIIVAPLAPQASSDQTTSPELTTTRDNPT
jgi:hypothetical protein